MITYSSYNCTDCVHSVVLKSSFNSNVFVNFKHNINDFKFKQDFFQLHKNPWCCLPKKTITKLEKNLQKENCKIYTWTYFQKDRRNDDRKTLILQDFSVVMDKRSKIKKVKGIWLDVLLKN